MFKWLLVIALTASVVFCAAIDWSSQRKLADRRAQIEAGTAELKPLRPIADEVAAYQRKKDALQKRIDAINQLKLNQRGPAAAVAKLAAIDPTNIESVAVVGEELVINRR